LEAEETSSTVTHGSHGFGLHQAGMSAAVRSTVGRETDSASHSHRNVVEHRASTANSALATAALNTELKAVKKETVQAISIARAEEANSVRLKGELAQAARSQYTLRMRLKEISAEAHKNLALLLRQLKVAKAATQRSEALLQNEIRKEAAKLKVAEESEIRLRNQLAVAETSSVTFQRSSAVAAAKAVAKSQSENKALSKLASELKSTKAAAEKEATALRGQLNRLREADTKAQSNLTERLKTAQQASTREKLKLEAKLKDAQQATEKVQDELEAEQFSEKLLQANLTRTQRSAETAAAENHKERMGLLVQVSTLQEQSANAQKKATEAGKIAKTTKEQAERRMDQEILAAKHKDAEHQRHISALLQEVQAAHANLTSAASAAALAQQRIATLQASVATNEEQIRVAALEANELRTARDAATKGEATFQRMDITAEASLKKARQEMDTSKSELQEVKSQLSSRVKDATSLSARCKSLERQLASLKQSSVTTEAKIKQQMHDTMISAASKVHELEDQSEELSTELEKEKKELSVASEESSKAKDTLMQETDAALRASQRADNLQNVLRQAQKDADSSGVRAADLARQVELLRQERSLNKEAMLERAKQQANLENQAETLESSREADRERAKQAEAENKKLKEQVHDLTGEEQRADELEEELASVRQSMQHKDTEEAQMAKKLSVLRSLKDTYSTEYDSSRKDLDSWHQKVDGLRDALQETKSQLASITHQRDKALGRAKQARSQEDEYFEENSHLEQQDEALNQKLAEVTAASNRSQADDAALKQEVSDLKNENAREKANSHAAWVENQDELMQARQDVKGSAQTNEDLQAELHREQAVLSDKERQALGLPPVKKAVTAAPQHAIAQASEAASNTAVGKPDESPASKPLIPQVEETSTDTKPAPKKLLAKRPEQEVAKSSASKTEVQVVPSATVVKAAKTELVQAPLPGEPPKPTDDDAAATLASVVDPKPAAPRSSLQKLADFFASPIQR
jgi:chromosome segregation ATPase